MSVHAFFGLAVGQALGGPTANSLNAIHTIGLQDPYNPTYNDRRACSLLKKEKKRQNEKQTYHANILIYDHVHILICYHDHILMIVY